MSQNHADLAAKIFKDELSWISSPDLRNFVLEVFVRFGHDFFFDRPASLSGRYHPKISAGNGGLVRHTKLVCFFASRFARMYGSGIGDDKGPHHDVVVAACILHDLMKEGDPTLAHMLERSGPDKGRFLTACHGVDLAKAIQREMFPDAKSMPRDIELVLNGIAGHMGVWTRPVGYQPAEIMKRDAEKGSVAWLVATSDYAAAQKFDAVCDTLTKDPLYQGVKPAAA